MKRAVLMARVSSDEQAKGYSLDVQLDSLTKYCQRNDVEIVQSFQEDFSAKTFDRPGFKKFLQFAKANKGKIDQLLFTSWDRFSRNIAQAYEMIGILRKLGIQPSAIEQPLDMTVPENKAMLAFYLALPEIENDRRSIKVLGGIRGAWKVGRWINRAPRGYRNMRDVHNKPIIVPNEKAEQIKSAFEKIANGFSQAEVRKELASEGYSFTKSVLSELLRNPVYMGKIFYPAENGEPSYLIQGIHEPLISEELFNKVQTILNEKHQKRNRPSITTKRDELPLRGILKCSFCDGLLTGSPSRSKTGKQYFYYHCNHCKKTRFRAEPANEKLEAILKLFTPSNDIINLYREMLKEGLGQKTKKSISERTSLNEKVKNLESRLGNLQDMLADKAITPSEYQNLKSKYEVQLIEIKSELLSFNDSEKDMSGMIETCIKKLSQLDTLYSEISLERKTRLLSSIFPEKLFFENNKYRTPILNKVMLLYLNIDKGLREKKTGRLSDFFELSGSVPGKGIEPPRGCPRQILSLLRLPIPPPGQRRGAKIRIFVRLYQKSMLFNLED